MDVQQDYTFTLSPNTKKRFVAGKYDAENHQPIYEIEILCPEHVRNLVEEKQLLLGSKENCTWIYEIYNKSSWDIFITVKKNGIVIK